MGGRGASSGISKYGNRYGSQYKTVASDGDVKFIKKNTRQSETVMETMSKGRVYAVIGGNEVKSIVLFDKKNKREKQIDIDHLHKNVKPHVHRGYNHQEYDPKGRKINLTDEEKKIVENVLRLWDNYKRKK